MAAGCVLVVDDDPVIQMLLRVNFEMAGYTVHVASDGDEGLDRTRELRPSVVLLDVMMPKMTGLEAVAAMKADPEIASIPVIMLSAKAQEGDQETGLSHGADDYVTKPFDPFELLDRVSKLLARKVGE